MNFKAIIFDLDGTLLDPLPDLATSVNAVLKSMRSTGQIKPGPIRVWPNYLPEL